MGKNLRGDAEKKKITYPSVLGLKESKEIQAGLIKKAVAAMNGFDHKADPLRELARYIIERTQ